MALHTLGVVPCWNTDVRTIRSPDLGLVNLAEIQLTCQFFSRKIIDYDLSTSRHAKHTQVRGISWGILPILLAIGFLVRSVTSVIFALADPGLFYFYLLSSRLLVIWGPLLQIFSSSIICRLFCSPYFDIQDVMIHVIDFSP